MINKFSTLVCTLSLLLPLHAAQAHTFPDHSHPAAGSTFSYSPGSVQIWFDGELEPLFSTLKVQNAAGEDVEKADTMVKNTLMQVSLPATLPKGVYHVLWKVVARDGHHTEGDYNFTLTGN